MVCRENKARSTAIRLAKELCKAQGHGVIHDRELQSAIHERQHHFDGAPDMSTDEQAAFIEGWRQQIENDPSIPQREKYRESHNQPGLLTRLDEEKERLKTGTLVKNGQKVPLENKNRNSGAQLQAMQYLGTMVPRIQQAKGSYFEINARHTGRSVQEVEDEWNAIMNRAGDGRGSVGISLRDNWRDDLAVAGLSAQAQSDIGQSKRARDALQEMEQRRVSALAARPSRATIRPEHRKQYRAVGAGGNVRCVACGQFGHDEPDCPNSDIVAQRADLEQDYLAATDALKAASIQRHLDSGDEPVYITPAGEELRGDEARAMLERDRDAIAKGQSVGTVADANTTLKRIANQDETLQKQLDERTGGVSTWISEVAYNEESGLMQVTTQPRKRKDGSMSPSATYSYRVSKAEAEHIMQSPDVGVAISGSVMRRGKGRTNDVYHWENAADAQAARAQVQCPTCGRWASMTSSHRCPVPGSASAEQESDERAAMVQWRKQARAAKEAGIEPPPKPPQRVNLLRQRQYRLPGDGGIADVPTRDDVQQVLSADRVASPSLAFRYPDATVSGQATVWRDESGVAIVSPYASAGGNGMRCTCNDYRAQGRCEHVGRSLKMMSNAWGANYTGDNRLRPSVSIADLRRRDASDTTFDAPDAPVERVDYSRIQRLRQQRQGDRVHGLFEKQRRGEPINGPTVRAPRDTEGNRADWPDTFARPGGRGGRNSSATIDLHDTSAVQYRLRAGLFARARKHYSVLRDPDGGMRITVPKARRNKDGSIPVAERRELAELLRVPAHQSRADGLYIPADTSWRHEFLSRAYGDRPPLRASKFSIA